MSSPSWSILWLSRSNAKKSGDANQTGWERGRNGKFPKLVRRGCKRFLGRIGLKASRCKVRFPGAKQVFDGARDSLETFPPNLLHKSSYCVSRCCTSGSGAVGSRSKQMSKAMKQMLVRGHNLQLVDEAGSRGTSSTREQQTKIVSTN